jgi:hypothetical protein
VSTGTDAPAASRNGVLRHWRLLVDAAIFLVLLGLSFFGIAGSDIAAESSQSFWGILALIYGVAGFALQWLHHPHRLASTTNLLRLAATWIGVFAAIQLMFLFIAAGRLDNPDAGLVNGLILALGAFVSGIYTSWRMILLGVVLALGTAFVAVVEQYLWVLLALAIVTIAALAWGSRFLRPTRRTGPG